MDDKVTPPDVTDGNNHDDLDLNENVILGDQPLTCESKSYPLEFTSSNSQSSDSEGTWVLLIRSILDHGFNQTSESAGYYCGLCNYATFMLDKWVDHSTESGHIQNEEKSLCEIAIFNCSVCGLTILHQTELVDDIFRSQDHAKLDDFATNWRKDLNSTGTVDSLDHTPDVPTLDRKPKLQNLLTRILELSSAEGLVPAFYCDFCSFSSLSNGDWLLHISAPGHPPSLRHGCQICQFKIFSSDDTAELILKSPEHLLIDRFVIESNEQTDSVGSVAKKPKRSFTDYVENCVQKSTYRRKYVPSRVLNTRTRMSMFLCGFCQFITHKDSKLTHIDSPSHIRTVLNDRYNSVVTSWCKLCYFTMSCGARNAQVDMQKHVLLTHKKSHSMCDFFTVNHTNSVDIMGHPAFKKCIILVKSGLLRNVSYCMPCLTVVKNFNWTQHLCDKNHIVRSKVSMIIFKCNICELRVYGESNFAEHLLIAHIVDIHGVEKVPKYLRDQLNPPVPAPFKPNIVLGDLLKCTTRSILCAFCNTISSGSCWKKHSMEIDHINAIVDRSSITATCKICGFCIFSFKLEAQFLINTHLFSGHGKNPSNSDFTID